MLTAQSVGAILIYTELNTQTVGEIGVKQAALIK